MKNPFVLCSRFYRDLKNRRAQKKASRQNLHLLSDLAFRERTLNQLEQTGLLAWNAQHRQLFIAQSLAALFLRDADTWVAFIHNVHQWLYLRLCTDAWDEYMQREELAAVREAMSVPGGSAAGSSLSRAQIDAIRLARRQQIAFSDMEPPRVEPFDFVIIQESTTPTNPIAVGHYDPNTTQMDIATWSDVAQLLKDGHQ